MLDPLDLARTALLFNVFMTLGLQDLNTAQSLQTDIARPRLGPVGPEQKQHWLCVLSWLGAPPTGDIYVFL